MTGAESIRFQHVMELFEVARCMPDTERDAFLQETCRESPDVLSEVRRLLAVHQKSHSPLDEPIVAASAWLQQDEQDTVSPPERIPGYRVIRQIGAGGMGTVYLAEQESPRRNVALKVIRPGLITPELRRRFELEAAVLGRLDHPGIAQIHEAGMYEDGAVWRPFFAMEYVDGPPLLDFVQRRNLELRHRLSLAALICDAVHHAHQKGVVHRDLKPGNILVRSDGQPKILDFGVARATDFDLQVTTIATGVGQLVGTLQYMSPEQVAGNAASVDTRADVYSLGVILFEMLAEKLPYDLTDCSIAGAARLILDAEPTTLSSISRTFRGDLNTIAMTALEKDPALRYQSASDLACDIRRYLNDQPLEARPASTIYQLRKFAQRNKSLVGGIIAVFLVLIVGLFGTGWGLLQAQKQRDEAVVQTRIAEVVNEFLNEDILSKANPNIRPGSNVKLRDVLDEAAHRIENRFPDQPAVEAALRRTIGNTYYGLGEHKSSELHYRRAMELYESLGDAENYIRARLEMVGPLFWNSQIDEIEKFTRQNIELAEQHYGMEHLKTAQAHQHLAITLRRQGRYDDAESEYLRAIQINETIARRRPLDEDERKGLIITKNNYAFLLSLRKRPVESELLLREVLVDWEDLYGRRNVNTAFALNNLGDALWRQEKLNEAEEVYREALEIRVELLGEEHPDTLVSKYAIGLIEQDTGHYEEAEQTMREVWEARETFLDPTHRQVIIAMQAVGVALENQDRNEQAAEILKEALDRAYSAFGPDHRTNKIRSNLIKSLRKMQASDEMAAVYLDYFDRLKRSLDSADLDETEWAERASSLARKLVTCESDAARDPEFAITLAQRAIEKRGQDPQTLDTLALAFAESGRLSDAVATQQLAIDLLPADSTDASRFKASLETFIKLQESAR